MRKKGMFVGHTCFRDEVFVFLVHFPEVQFFFEFPNKMGYFLVWTTFQHELGVPDGTKSWFLQLIWIKRCCS